MTRPKQTQKMRALAVLSADYTAYLKAEAKLKQSTIACRTSDLLGEPLCTYEEIGKALGITRQSVHAYIRRWS